MIKRQRHETEQTKFAKRNGLKWLGMVANPYKQGPKSDNRCLKCGFWLYAEGLLHDCEVSRKRGR